VKFLGGQSIPIFLGNAGIGENFGQTSPKVLGFDVYFEDAPVEGFSVSHEEAPLDDLDLMVYYDNEPPESPETPASLEDFEVIDI